MASQGKYKLLAIKEPQSSRSIHCTNHSHILLAASKLMKTTEDRVRRPLSVNTLHNSHFLQNANSPRKRSYHFRDSAAEKNNISSTYCIDSRHFEVGVSFLQAFHQSVSLKMLFYRHFCLHMSEEAVLKKKLNSAFGEIILQNRFP